ncbi:MAG: hypothetical protein WD625_08990, partial [Balneolales bacterium]
SGAWKLMKFYETDEVKVYNLDDDVAETRNLANDHPEVRDRLYRELEQWLDENEAPLPRFPDVN